ncbi:hypothetical protein [Streptomyces sp. Z26]|uniref:hypothetical protein n=1 Tax=Streptomyces TaxID=1883 RepID=UPI000FCAD5AF|nr:hypothetical protein [Streptomyces sp. Z26]
MSNGQPPPGPYGGQPDPYGTPPPPPQGAPNPYGGPPTPPPPGQPGYGYPQQPNPYAQQGPYGPQQPYGPPGPPIPGQGGGQGRKVALGIGALVVVGALIGGVLALSGGDDDGGDDADGTKGGKRGTAAVAPYKIVPPESVLDGEYTSAGTGSSSEDLAGDAQAKRVGVENGTGASDDYRSTSKEQLQLAGVYGKVADPEKAADGMFDIVHDNQAKGAQVIQNYRVETTDGPQEYTPEGFDGALIRCETRRQTGQISGQQVELEFPTCVWADNAAVGVVSQTGAAPAAGAGVYGESMTQDELAEATAEIREAAREEI